MNAPRRSVPELWRPGGRRRSDPPPAAGDGDGASLSADGRHVAFRSNAPNLVPGDINGTFDVFVGDMWTGAVTLVSRGPQGQPGDFQSVGPAVTDKGVVAFGSGARKLVEDDMNSAPDFYPCDVFLWA